MNSKEHLEEAEKWLEEAKRGYAAKLVSEVALLRIQVAVDIARAHAIISVQKEDR